MKSLKIAFLFTIAAISLLACSEKKNEQVESAVEAPKVQKHLIVYGSSECQVCIDFKQKLDSAKIDYEFRDVLITEKKYDEEMLNKLNKVGYKGYAQFPVVDIEGRMMVKPGFQYVLKALY